MINWPTPWVSAGQTILITGLTLLSIIVTVSTLHLAIHCPHLAPVTPGSNYSHGIGVSRFVSYREEQSQSSSRLLRLTFQVDSSLYWWKVCLLNPLNKYVKSIQLEGLEKRHVGMLNRGGSIQLLYKAVPKRIG